VLRFRNLLERINKGLYLVEIYFSIVQRKVLSPNDFASLHALAERFT
jgi:hypothetical protein